MNVLANGHYMRFEDFVKSYQTFNLKILSCFLNAYSPIQYPYNVPGDE